MAEVLVLAELNPAGDGTGAAGVRKTTLEALTAARALGEPSAVVDFAGRPPKGEGVKVVDEGDGADKLVDFLVGQKIV